MRVESRFKSALVFVAAISLLDYSDASSRSTVVGPRQSAINETEASEEERVPPSVLEGATEVASSIVPLKHEWNIGLLQLSTLSAKDAFAHLELEKAGENLPSFNALIEHVLKMNNGDIEAATAAIAEVLPARYTNVVLVEMLTASSTFTATKAVATRLLSRVIDSLPENRKAAFTNFKVLKLDIDMDTQRFIRWFESLKKINSGDPAATMPSMLEVLKVYLTDVGLLRKLEDFKQVKATTDIANHLQIAVVDSLPEKRKFAFTTFDSLGMDWRQNNMEFVTWAKNVKRENNGDPEATMASMLEVLLYRSSDKEDLLRVLEAYSKSDRTKYISAHLQVALKESTKKMREAAFTMFKSLKLDTHMDAQNLKALTTYVEKISNGDIEAATTMIIEVLLAHYTDVVLVKKLTDLSKDIPTNANAARLLSRVMDSLPENRKVAFTNFKLRELDMYMNRQNFGLWANDVKMNIDDPELATATMLEVLLAHDTDARLVNKLSDWSKFEGTKDIVTSLLIALMDSWVAERKDAYAVFELLELNTNMGNHNFRFWTKYVAKIHNGDSVEATASELRVMMKYHSGVFLAIRLQAFKRDPEMKDIATSLQTAVIDSLPEKKRAVLDKYFELELDANNYIHSSMQWSNYVAELYLGDYEAARAAMDEVTSARHYL